MPKKFLVVWQALRDTTNSNTDSKRTGVNSFMEFIFKRYIGN